MREAARAVRDESGTIIRYVGIATNVSHLRRTEVALDEARRIAKLGVWQLDLGTGNMDLSPEIYAQFAITQGAFPPTLESMLALIHEDDRPMVRAHVAAASAGEEADIVFRVPRADATVAWLWVQLRAATSPDGAVVKLYGACQDITERRISEQQLARNGQLAALGELTGGIAHDVNNMLAVMRLNLEMIEAADTDASVRECAANALGAADRGAKLTGQLLAFARRQPMQKARLDLREVLGGIMRMLGHGLGVNVAISHSVEPEDLAIEADQAQLDSAIMNLALNARDSMPDGGTITITATPAELSASERLAMQLPDSDYVAITVADTGKGMPPAVLKRACEPFFSTKGSGRGTGLGLAMVYGFVRQAGGEMRIDSTEGSGTRVTLWLRRAAAASAPKPGTAHPTAVVGAVLLVEDDEALRDATARILRDAGHCVYAAGNGEAALSLLDLLPSPPELLLSDVMLGTGIDCFALAARVHERLPSIAVVYITGYAGNAAPLQADAPLLRKPYRTPELLATIAQALDAARTAPGAPAATERAAA